MRFPSACVVAALLFVAGCSGGGIVTSATDGEVAETSVVDSGARPDTNIARPDTNAMRDTFDPPPTVDGGECNSVANVATSVTSKTVTGTAPSALGGFISAGTYRLTDLTFFSAGGSSFPALAASVTTQISGGVMQTAHTTSGESGTSTATYTTSGTRLTISQTCPRPDTDLMGYTANSTQLIFYFEISDEGGFRGTLRYTFAK